MVKKLNRNIDKIENVSIKITQWIGTPWSIIIHTVLFGGIFFLRILGLHTDDILLILTTLVSLEAIYLSIFIQMSVNRTTASIEAARDDIEDIQEDVEGLEENVEDISEDIEEIQHVKKRKLTKKNRSK